MVEVFDSSVVVLKEVLVTGLWLHRYHRGHEDNKTGTHQLHPTLKHFSWLQGSKCVTKVSDFLTFPKTVSYQYPQINH